MSNQREEFDYAIRVTANLGQAKAGLNGLQQMLLGNKETVGLLNSALGKTALTLFSVYEAGKMTLKVMQQLTRGVSEFQIATQRLQAMGFSPAGMQQMVKAAQTMSTMRGSVISTAGAIDLESTLAARGITGKNAQSLMRMMGTQTEALTGMTGDAAGSKGFASQMMQTALTITAFRKSTAEDVRGLDETLFRLSEVMKEQFPAFADNIATLASTYPNLTDKGVRNLAALSMAGGDPGMATGAAGELRNFGLGMNTREALPFVAMTKMFGISSAMSLIRGRTFQLNPKFNSMLQQDPTGFLSNVLIPQMEKTGMSPQNTLHAIQQIFGPDSATARSAMVMINNGQRFGAAQNMASGGLSSSKAAGQFGNSFPVVWAGFSTSLHNMTQSLALPGIVPAVKALTGLFNDIAKFGQKHPTMTGVAAEGLTVGGGILSALGLRKLWRTLLGKGGGAGGGGPLSEMQKEMNALAKGGGQAEEQAAASRFGKSPAIFRSFWEAFKDTFKTAVTPVPKAAGPSVEQRVASAAPGSWEEMIQARGMQNTLLAKFIRNPAPALRVISTFAKAADILTLFSYTKDESANPENDANFMAQFRFKNAQAYAQAHDGQWQTGPQVVIHVHVDDPDAGNKVVRKISRAIHQAARNTTTAGGKQMSSVQNGGG